MQQIEEIVHKIENEEPDIDELSVLIKTAAGLISNCKQRLRDTEEDLNQVLNKIEEK